MVEPDYIQPTLRQGHRAVLSRKRGGKAIRMVYASGAETTASQPTSAEERARYCLSDDEVLALADAALVSRQTASCSTCPRAWA
ncbi:MAG: PEP/pyruvate-binding domain-containing protein [Roseateles sp.]